jgi:hypothetical protein
MLDQVREINLLWEPVYPYLAHHIANVYGRGDGAVHEVGPFCGVIYDLVRQQTGASFCIASFPAGMQSFYAGEIERRKMEEIVRVVPTTPELTGIGDNTVDLLVFRGALFFPSFFTVDHQAILRALKPGGTAFVGGGFGKYTPPEVIRPLADRSRELNYLIGKKETTVDDIRKELEENNITENTEIVTEGGLWVVMKKPLEPLEPLEPFER